jgi:hypothetical protein
MANGEIIAKVEELLEGEGKLSTSNALRLSLTLQKQMYEQLKQVVEHQGVIDARLADHEKRMECFAPKAEVEEVKHSSIVLWVFKNPKTALLLFALTYILDPRDLILQGLRAVGWLK